MPTFTPFFGLRSLRDLWRDERGSIAVTFAALLIPMMLVVGLAVDYARMVQFRAALQNAVDEAAVAGASAFSSTSKASTAQTVATNFYNQAILPTAITRNAPSVSTNTSGTINPALGTAPAYSVTVSASASVSTTLLSLLLPSVTIGATGTAGAPVVTPKLTFTNINSSACDGNAVYLYEVPSKSNGTGYDYSSVPTFSTGTNGNYYFIGSSISSMTAPSGNSLPTMTANQPLGVAMWNKTDGNTSNGGCGVTVTGANSYGAPYMAQQWFYSSYVGNAQSPSEKSNYTYQITVKTNSSGTITQVSGQQENSDNTWTPLNGGSNFPLGSGSYNNLYTYFGVNAPGTSNSNCVAGTPSTTNGITTTTYTCQTQYFNTQTSKTSNCSLYVQTGMTNSQVSSLSSSTSAPSAARGNCFDPTTQVSSSYAPSCSQLSALGSGSGSSATAPAEAFWWDDAGGVGPNEQYYSPSAHCSGTSSGGPGYGEDCQYKNNYFAMQCTTSGGSGSGYTEVVLTQ